MLTYLLNESNLQLVTFLGILLAFAGTCYFTAVGKKLLPRDLGRDFAVNGKLSAGKPRGAGFIFILVFVAVCFLFGNMNIENIIYLILVAASMMTGFLDDASKTPWGEWKKGLLDLIIAIMVAITFLNFNTSTITLELLNMELTLHPLVFGILAVALVWISINVTNCADGVDGLSATLTCITLTTIYIIDYIKELDQGFPVLILVMIACILGYLWFNATPSIILMGDAGSRAMGLFISIAILKSQSPVLYLLVAFVLLVDGGIGLLKVSLIRVFKIHILKKTRTPLHDHVRKNWDWSNTHTVFRFAIIQIVCSIIAIYLVVQ